MISLHVQQLQKSYGAHTVFSGVTFTHQQGSLGIAGPNGSGKSTFLKCLGFLLRPTRGDMAWKNNGDLLEKEAIRPLLGYAAPYINLYDELSCRENLEFLMEVRKDSANRPIDVWIGKVGLRRVADQPFGKLSTGQQQRLRLASALFHDPDILLLDEPGSNLDEAGRSLITGIADEFNKSGKLMIVASNDPEELSLCDRIFSIEQESFL